MTKSIVNEAIAENSDSGNTQDRSMDGANTTKDACATEDYRRDGVEFVAGASVRFGLAEAGSVNDGSKA